MIYIESRTTIQLWTWGQANVNVATDHVSDNEMDRLLSEYIPPLMYPITCTRQFVLLTGVAAALRIHLTQQPPFQTLPIHSKSNSAVLVDCCRPASGIAGIWLKLWEKSAEEFPSELPYFTNSVGNWQKHAWNRSKDVRENELCSNVGLSDPIFTVATSRYEHIHIEMTTTVMWPCHTCVTCKSQCDQPHSSFHIRHWSTVKTRG